MPLPNRREYDFVVGRTTVTDEAGKFVEIMFYDNRQNVAHHTFNMPLEAFKQLLPMIENDAITGLIVKGRDASQSD